jgi:hypothetical protein
VKQAITNPTKFKLSKAPTNTLEKELHEMEEASLLFSKQQKNTKIEFSTKNYTDSYLAKDKLTSETVKEMAR